MSEDQKRSDDEAAEAILIAHQRHRGGCLCGWSELGRSHPGHQVAMLREAALLNDQAVRASDDRRES
jgi:hypothetical protein